MTTAELWVQVDAKRSALGLSGRGLAKALGTAPSSTSRWAAGRDPSAALVLRALEWLGECLSKRQRAATPPAFAALLISLASLTLE